DRPAPGSRQGRLGRDRRDPRRELPDDGAEAGGSAPRGQAAAWGGEIGNWRMKIQVCRLLGERALSLTAPLLAAGSICNLHFPIFKFQSPLLRAVPGAGLPT